MLSIYNDDGSRRQLAVDEFKEAFPEWEATNQIALKERLTEYKAVKDELRADLFELPDTALNLEAERLILLDFYRDKLLEIERNLARILTLQKIASGKPALPGTITLAMIDSAKQTPIADLVPEIRFQKSGGRLKALCPFHAEQSPSLTVFPNNRFKCFGCGENGDAIHFIRKLKNLAFPNAVRYCLQVGGSI